MIHQLSLDFESNYHIRRHLTRGRSYCIPVNPYLAECLEDLLIRAAWVNGFHSRMSYKLLGIQGAVIPAMLPGFNRYNVTAEALSTVLGNIGGPEELRRLVESKRPPKKHLRPLLDVWLDGNTLSACRRVSPLALRKSPYLRAVWRVWPIAFDPDTKEMLIRNCPVCHKQLLAGFAGDVWCCDRCGEIDSDGQLFAVDLRDFPQAIVDQSLWENLDFATSFVDPNAQGTRNAVRSKLHSDFDRVSDGEIFEIIHAFARVMSDDALKIGRFEISPEVFSSAALILRGWPKALEEAFAHNADSKYSTGTLSHLIYNTRLDEGIRSRIKDIISASAIRPDLASFPPVSEGKTLVNAAEYRALKRWISRGEFDTSSLLHSDAMVLRARQDIRNLTQQIGISVPSLMDMATKHIVSPKLLRTNSSSETAAEIKKFEQRLVKHSARGKTPKNAQRLPRAVGAIYNQTADPWSRILNAMFSGQIEYWVTARSGKSLLERTYINDLVSLWRILARTDNALTSFHTIPLAKLEAGSMTRLEIRGLTLAAEANLIDRPFTRESVVRFRAEYEPSSLLSVRHPLSMGQPPRAWSAVESLLLAAEIEPVLRYGQNSTIWGRADVERCFGAELMPCIE